MAFDLLGWTFKKSTSQQEIQNIDPFIQKTDDDGAFIVTPGGYLGHNSYTITADQQFDSEVDLIKKYREISVHPEIDAAINEIVNEAINGEEGVDPITIILDKLELSEGIKNKIEDEFKYICRLLNINTESYELFRKFYVDGRLYHYIVIDKNNTKNGILELRYIPSIHMKKIREDKTSIGPGGVPQTESYQEYFLYTKDWAKTKNAGAIKVSKDSVCYVHSGLIDEDKNLIFGWLHKAIKPANQLRMMEDALIIYRLSRAPERRIFYIDVGNLPKTKAEEYMKSLQNKFKNKLVYDAVTGETKDARNTLSMLEDFWLPRGMNGKGTEVTTLPGGQTLGQIDDIEYFKKKLYMSLNVPIGRITSDQNQAMFNIGRSDSISRDEVKFSRFIARLRKRFSKLFLQLLKTQLVLKRIVTPEDWDIIEEKITFNYQQDTFFAELKDAEILKERLTTLQMAEPYIGRYFSQEYVRKHILKQTEDEAEQMIDQIKQEPPMIQDEQDINPQSN